MNEDTKKTSLQKILTVSANKKKAQRYKFPVTYVFGISNVLALQKNLMTMKLKNMKTGFTYLKKQEYTLIKISTKTNFRTVIRPD